VQRSAPRAELDIGRSTSVERAIAKSAGIAHAGAVPSGPEPAARGEPASPRLEIDAAMLARAGIFTPDSTLNRTTEEFRLIERAVLERAGKAQPTASPTPIWSW
jgi:hypothetical protein